MKRTSSTCVTMTGCIPPGSPGTYTFLQTTIQTSRGGCLDWPDQASLFPYGFGGADRYFPCPPWPYGWCATLNTSRGRRSSSAVRFQNPLRLEPITEEDGHATPLDDGVCIKIEQTCGCAKSQLQPLPLPSPPPPLCVVFLCGVDNWDFGSGVMTNIKRRTC